MRVLPKCVASIALLTAVPVAAVLAAARDDWLTVDVIVAGNERALSTVSAEQFQVLVDGKLFEHFEVEEDCDPQLDAVRAASYLFYFDQPHLSAEGREEALRITRKLMPLLLDRGARILLVSNSRRLRFFGPMTSNEEHLRVAVESLDSAPDSRARSAGLLQQGTIARYRELERSLDRLTLALDRFALEPGPNIAFYFADRLTSIGPQSSDDSAAQRETRRFASGAAGAAVARAAAYGVRFYTVTPGDSGAWSEPVQTRGVDSDGKRTSFVATLAQLSDGTGGRRLGRATTADELADFVRRDLSCMYLLHLDRTKLPSSRILPLSVRLDGRARARARSWIVPQSDLARMHSGLLGRLDLSKKRSAEAPLEIHLIPTDYADGSFSALVQVVAPGARSKGETWQLAGSLTAQRMVREDFAGVYESPTPGLPLVLEAEARFGAGLWEGFAVAAAGATGKPLSGSGSEEWPDPDRESAMVGPIVVLQESRGSFLRRGVVRSTGSLARSRRRPLRVDARSALMGIVCGGAGSSGKLRVSRELLGQGDLTFPDQEIDLGSDRCAVLSDLIPSGALKPGLYRYRVSVMQGEREVAWGMRLFSAAEPD